MRPPQDAHPRVRAPASVFACGDMDARVYGICLYESMFVLRVCMYVLYVFVC